MWPRFGLKNSLKVAAFKAEINTGDAAYNAATAVQRSFTVTRVNQTITFGGLTSQPFGTPITVSASASSGLAVAFTSGTTSVCTVSGTTVTPVSVGTCTINANQAGNVTYNPATQVAQSFSIVKGNQTISFGSILSQPLTSTPTISATTNAGLTVALSSATPSVCTVSGTTATLLSLGTCTINGNQAGSANWNAAPQASVSFTVIQGNQAITNFAPTTPTGYRLNGTFPLTATGGASGNPVVFASTSPTICTVSGSTATIVTVGTCTLTANQAGNASYNAAPEVTATVNITQGTQTISVFYPNSSLAAGATVQLTATGGGSPNLVTFTSGSTSICTVSASTAGANSTSVASLSVLAAGDCLLTANQAGDALYLAAAPVSLTLTIGAGSQIFYVHTDHLGTPRTITQASGNGKVWEWKNDDPFGANMPDENPSGIAGTFKYNLRFPGQYYDQETGTYYNYFRDYDPSVGRYVQSDPIGLEGGNNTYSYVGNNPASYIDPTGEILFAPVLVNAGIGAITDLAFQLANNGGRLECIDVSQVLLGGVLGAATGGFGGALQKARNIREAYKAGLNNALYSGPTQAEASLFRRELGAQLKNETPSIFRGAIFRRNAAKHGDVLGPTGNYAHKGVDEILLKNSGAFDAVLKLPSKGMETGGAVVGGAAAFATGECKCTKK